MKKSSDVKNYFYNSDTKKLRITFKTGSEYEYSNISRQRFQAFDKTDSLGKYVNNKLKDLDAKKIN